MLVHQKRVSAVRREKHFVLPMETVFAFSLIKFQSVILWIVWHVKRMKQPFVPVLETVIASPKEEHISV